MDLKTTYLGLELKNPVVASASPLTEKVDDMKRLEDSGVGAVVMRSLFEEQITREKEELDHFLNTYADSFAEALSFFPEPEEYRSLDAEVYLKEISRAKEKLSIPVIASLNGSSSGGWSKYAQKLAEAGADAIELNIYYIPTDISVSPQSVESVYMNHLREVKSSVSIPVAMKLNPYFSSFAHFAAELDRAGADGLVLFNRFYQSDFDLDAMEVRHDLELSTPYESRLSLRWLGILYGHVNASLAATTGIYSGLDVLKSILAGANVAMVASSLLRYGVSHINTIFSEMQEWMNEKEYTSIEQMRGAMSFRSVENPEEFVRANYMRTLMSYRE